MEALRRLGDDGRAACASSVAALRRPRPRPDRLLAVLGSSAALGDHLVAPPRALGRRSTRRAAAHRGASAATSCVAAVGRPRTRRGRARTRRTTRCASPTGAGCSAIAALRPRPPTRRRTSCPRSRGDAGRPGRAPRSRPRWRSRASEVRGGRRRLPARRHRHGQVRRPRAELRQRRRRHLRRRAGRRRGDETAALDRPAPRWRPALMRACSASTAEGTLWPVDAALRPEGKAGPLVRTLASHRRVLRAVGQDLGVPGAAQGPAGRRRPGARARRYVDAIAPDGLAGGRAGTTSSRTCRRCAAGSRSTCRPTRGRRGSSSSGRAACATSSSASSCCSSCTAAPTSRCARRTTLEALAALAAGGYVGRDDAAALDACLPVPAHARAPDPAVPAAPHAPDARPTRPTCAGSAARSGTGATRRSEVRRRSGRRQAREVRRLHERLFYRPLLDRRRPAEHATRRG